MRTRVLALVAGIGLAACAGQPESPGASLSVGSTGAVYALSAVDGKALPANAYFGVDVAVNATGGRLTLSADHAYTLDVDYDRHFASGNRDVPFTLSEPGTWSVSGATLTLAAAGGSAHKATIAGNAVSLTITVPDSSPPERATRVYTFTRTP